MDSELVLLHYDSEAAAELALGTMRNLAAQGFVQLEDAAIISGDAEDSAAISAAEDSHRLGRASLGGVLGLGASGVVGLPVVGVLAGAGLAANLGAAR